MHLSMSSTVRLIVNNLKTDCLRYNKLGYLTSYPLESFRNQHFPTVALHSKNWFQHYSERKQGRISMRNVSKKKKERLMVT